MLKQPPSSSSSRNRTTIIHLNRNNLDWVLSFAMALPKRFSKCPVQRSQLSCIAPNTVFLSKFWPIWYFSHRLKIQDAFRNLIVCRSHYVSCPSKESHFPLRHFQFSSISMKIRIFSCLFKPWHILFALFHLFKLIYLLFVEVIADSRYTNSRHIVSMLIIVMM